MAVFQWEELVSGINIPQQIRNYNTNYNTYLVMDNDLSISLLEEL